MPEYKKVKVEKIIGVENWNAGRCEVRILGSDGYYHVVSISYQLYVGDEIEV